MNIIDGRTNVIEDMHLSTLKVWSILNNSIKTFITEVGRSTTQIKYIESMIDCLDLSNQVWFNSGDISNH